MAATPAYCLVYEKTQVLDGYFTRIVGPFASPEAASKWYHANTPDEPAVIDAILNMGEPT